MRKRSVVWLLCALMLLPALSAHAASYSFPYAGVRVSPGEGWTLLLPETLEEQRAFIERIGADMDVMRADYAANHTVFEAFLPGGAQVSLSVLETEETAAWQAMERMNPADAEKLLSSYDHPPYAHVGWSREAPGYFAYDWAFEMGGTSVTFARLTTVRNGALYMLTAMGAGLSTDVLHAANLSVLTAMTYTEVPVNASGEQDAPQRAALPEPIADDGTVTPLALIDFTGVTDVDTTTLTIQTLPDAELMLHTPSDTLRGRADENGLHSYMLSTRRETTYTYTLTATVQGRRASKVDIAIERTLSADALAEAYKSAAAPLEALAYPQVAETPEAYADKAVTFRGKAASFMELNGFPCVLVYTSNPGTGAWSDPVWVMLTKAVPVAEGEMLTVYGDIRGDALAYEKDGAAQGAPVVIGNYIEK